MPALYDEYVELTDTPDAENLEKRIDIFVFCNYFSINFTFFSYNIIYQSITTTGLLKHFLPKRLFLLDIGEKYTILGVINGYLRALFSMLFLPRTAKRVAVLVKIVHAIPFDKEFRAIKKFRELVSTR